MEETNISHLKNPLPFSKVLLEYVKDKKDLFIPLENPHVRSTRSSPFSIADAKEACELYIKLLWKSIRKRVAKTDFSNSPVTTREARALAEEALKQYNSIYGARFCTHMWFKGATSKVITKMQRWEC